MGSAGSLLLFPIRRAVEIFCEGEVDLASLDEEEKKPPLERKEYAIFAELSTDALPLVKELIEENEDRK